MTSVTIDVPLMYADHHVVEVRRILFEVPGVEAVDASSAFQVVKIEYDPEKTSEDILKQVLDKNGYLGDLRGTPGVRKARRRQRRETYFRHTAAYESHRHGDLLWTRDRRVGRPLWPCPGMGPAPNDG